MKIAIFSESRSDEAALRVLVEAIVGVRLEPIDLNLRSRGWPAVRGELRAVIRDLWINQRADGLVISVDTDRSPVHEPSHLPAEESSCRQCGLQGETDKTVAELASKHPQSVMLIAVATASPAVEAWLLHGKPNAPTEASWRAVLLTQPSATDVKLRVKDLKQLVYGTPNPGETAAIAQAKAEAQRIIGDLSGLSAAFPSGFGTMAQKVAGWKTSQT